MAQYFREAGYTVRALKSIYGRYCRLELWLYVAYKNSTVYEMIKSFYNKVIIAFRYSLLGRITEIGEAGGNPGMLNNSKAVSRMLNFYNKLRISLSDYPNTSKIVYSVMEFKRELCSRPVKTGGTIVFTAVLTNMFLSILMRKEIGALEWSMRWVLLFVGFCGMLCEAEWYELKRTSWFIKLMKKENK